MSITEQPVDTDAVPTATDIREAVDAVATRYDRAYFVECLRADRPTTELNTALGESGLLGLGVSAELGGQGGGLVEQAVLVEQLGRHGLPSYNFLIANFARKIVIAHGGDEQIAHFVPPTLIGASQSCFALTESDAGTNTFALRTTAERIPDGWRVNGQKIFISAAGDADRMLLVARTAPRDETAPTAGLSLFIVDLPATGMTSEPLQIRTTAPEHQYSVFFDDMLLPPDALVGQEGRGVAYLFDGLNPERVLAAAMSIGLGFYVLEKGARYSRDRAPFGQAIGSYQAVQHPLARAYIDLEAARVMNDRAAAEFDAGENAGLSSNAAKLLASEAAYNAYDATVQAHGGYAFDDDSDLMALYQLIRFLRIAPINNEMVLNYVAQKALKLPRAY